MNRAFLGVAVVCVAASCAAAVFIRPAAGRSAGGSAAAAPSPQTAQIHGFDFLFGTWSTRYRRLVHPLSGSHEWTAFDGKAVIWPLWDGRGNIESGDMFRDPTTHMVTVRLYNEKTDRWSLYIGTDRAGMLEPPQVGRFDATGVGQFDAHDTFDGKKVIIRYRWRPGDANHCRFEQSFSADDGKAWETNWTTDYTRINSGS